MKPIRIDAETETVRLDFSDEPAVMAFFDRAFSQPQRHFLVEPVDVRAAEAWLERFTNMVNFVWCGGVKSFDARLEEGGSLKFGQLISFEELVMRGRCGWTGEEETCLAPVPEGEFVEQDACGRRLCHPWYCAVAYEADVAEIRERDPDLYASDYEGEDDEQGDTGWMVLNHRPRFAYVPNVTVLGCDPRR